MTTKVYRLVLLLGCFFLVESINMDDFFPDINGNLTKITWAHAVNNKTYLAASLNSSAIMMLEADVIYGKINGSGELIPIMGHPPATQSDLSLEEFLTTIYNFNKDENNRKVRKGVKLDFKSTEVFTKSVDFIKKQYNQIDYPLWINADIIRGPLNFETVPVDPNIFLSTAKAFDKSVLSLGWTTTRPTMGLAYNNAEVNAMIEVIKENDVKQEITFAVRAGIAAQSLAEMKLLKDEVNNCTLTIWSSEGDEVDVPKLRDLIFEYGIKRVYVDVPKDLRDRLDLGNK
ncbi:Protein FAM151B-like Protein [Tribolium castaneum]|uniref:Protein FAM151B-like Protein n=2 Tax=Tribolium castaneum TaxID=7070 RepID=D2A1M8_TRICA|nr:PREDICTED: protein FAM151B isoform X1 [Tribolium castaneum]XP_008192809.1 PREDICTED: protein FAM151B isoform X1 [Tribolium castaneum]EFA02695.2 Protein FAM151B-like Protein [Tribolium castaneum]|eukprot:XP_008192808.1 PREDICTED: protein FAM151B isoform X1 [Tribolium castaneum]